MGGVFPRGILIGEVETVIKDDDNVGNLVLIKLASKLKDERYVCVLQRKEVLDN